MSEESRNVLEERLKAFLMDFVQEMDYFDLDFGQFLWHNFCREYNYTADECPPHLFNDFLHSIGQEQRRPKYTTKELTEKIREFILESDLEEKFSLEQLWRAFLREEDIFVEHCSFDEFRSELTKFANKSKAIDIKKYSNMVIDHLKSFTGDDKFQYILLKDKIFIYNLWCDFEMNYPLEEFSSFAIYSAVTDTYAETIPKPTFAPALLVSSQVNTAKIISYLHEFDGEGFKYYKFLDESVIYHSWNSYRRRYNLSAVECSYYIFRVLAKHFGESNLEIYKIPIWEYLETCRQKGVFQYERFMDRTFIFSIWHDYRRVNSIQGPDACPFALFATVADLFAATLPKPSFGTIAQEVQIDKVAISKFISEIIDGGDLDVKDLLNDAYIFSLWTAFQSIENKTAEEVPYPTFKDVATSLTKSIYLEIQISIELRQQQVSFTNDV